MAVATNALDTFVRAPERPRTSAVLAFAVGHVLDWIDDSFPPDQATGTRTRSVARTHERTWP